MKIFHLKLLKHLLSQQHFFLPNPDKKINLRLGIAMVYFGNSVVFAISGNNLKLKYFLIYQFIMFKDKVIHRQKKIQLGFC